MVEDSSGQEASAAEHSTVLLKEAVDGLAIDADGLYIDGTFGRGGHTAELLSRLSDRGSVIAIDKDLDAIAAGQVRFAEEDRLTLVHASFAELAEIVKQAGKHGEVSGVLLDLGVSSPQLDVAERGFSFLRDGPLDMRMDTSKGLSAAEWLASADEQEIAKVIKEYGEERFARRMAAAIVRERAEKPIERTVQLAKILADAHPAWERGKHPATKAFQAIRIFINRELADLEDLLQQVIDSLAVGGRLVVISFHSLEDRRVKRFIRDQERGIKLPKNLPIPDVDRGVRLVKVGKAIKPAVIEVENNVRARSAVMRIAERVA
jgi:16S rRNA (cytosine1402-N4)-methyltransferase